MSIAEHNMLTAHMPSWLTSPSSKEASETITHSLNPMFKPEHREIRIEISSTLRRTPWFDQIRTQLQEFLILNENWNGYGESPIHESAIKRTVAVLDAITTEATPRPDVVPTSAGGVQIEWALDGFEVEVEILATGPAQVFIAEPSGREQEWLAGSTSQAWIELQSCIEKMGSQPVD